MLRKREVLAMAASAGVSMLLLPQDFAWGAPIPTPRNFPDNFGRPGRFCDLQQDPVKDPEPKAFTPPSYEVKLRRKTGNVVPDSDFARMYERAYELLRKKAAENPGDPRYYTLQAEVHCRYCTGYYFYRVGAQRQPIDIHNSYLFLPWHRLYLHFHERILHSLLKEDAEFGGRADEFALTFWNYDNPDFENNPDTRMPDMFLKNPSYLYHPGRNITSTEDRVRLFAGDITEANHLRLMRSVTQDTSSRFFFGGPVRANDWSQAQRSRLEASVHGSVHNWVGGDMGGLDTSAKDPIFFGGHHSNIDRLWDVWYTLPTDEFTGPRTNPVIPGTDITDPDWLNTGFLFFDENGDMVLAKVSDALDTVKSLKYRYEDVPNPWINYVPPRDLLSSAPSAPGARRAPSPPPIVVPADSGPFQLGKTPVVVTPTPRTPETEEPEVESFSLFDSEEGGSGGGVVSRRRGTENKERAVLLKGVKYDMSKIVEIHVFVNLPGANRDTSILLPNFLGSFTTVPMGGMDMGMEGETLAFSISRALAELNISEEDATLTLVPMNPDFNPNVTIESVVFK